MTRRARTMGIIPSGTIQVSESVYFPCVFKQLLNEIISHRLSLCYLNLVSRLGMGHRPHFVCPLAQSNMLFTRTIDLF